MEQQYIQLCMILTNRDGGGFFTLEKHLFWKQTIIPEGTDFDSYSKSDLTWGGEKEKSFELRN